jgi:membrane protein
MLRHLKSDLLLLSRVMAERSRELRLGQSAASLSFASLMALVPLLTVVLATITAFPIFAHLRETVQTLLYQSLLPDAFANTIFRYLNQFVAKARTLSIVGIGFLLVTATVMMLTLDRTLNLLWRVKTPRPLLHRLSVYWLALLLGPVLVGAGAALATLLAGGVSRAAVRGGMLGFEWWDLANLMLTTAAFTLCYRWIPNVHVRWKHARLGGAIGAGLSELARAVFAGYFVAVPTYQQVYGPLAAIPALLIWTYLTWWVFLAGALLTSVLPEWRRVGASISHSPETKETAS